MQGYLDEIIYNSSKLFEPTSTRQNDKAFYRNLLKQWGMIEQINPAFKIWTKHNKTVHSWVQNPQPDDYLTIETRVMPTYVKNTQTECSTNEVTIVIETTELFFTKTKTSAENCYQTENSPITSGRHPKLQIKSKCSNLRKKGNS